MATPPGFAAAVENGNHPSAGDTALMDQVLAGHEAKVLLYNARATSPVRPGIYTAAP